MRQKFEKSMLSIRFDYWRLVKTIYMSRRMIWTNIFLNFLKFFQASSEKFSIGFKAAIYVSRGTFWATSFFVFQFFFGHWAENLWLMLLSWLHSESAEEDLERILFCFFPKVCILFLFSSKTLGWCCQNWSLSVQVQTLKEKNCWSFSKFSSLKKFRGVVKTACYTFSSEFGAECFSKGCRIFVWHLSEKISGGLG